MIERMEGGKEVKGIYKLIVEGIGEVPPSPTLLQTSLTKRRGTLTVLAEYKRHLNSDGFVNDIFEPNLMSPVFREFGASAVSVMTDKRMGGCGYEDLKVVGEEQQEAMGEFPGPLPVVCSDLIVSPYQIALAKASGASGIVLKINVIGSEKTMEFKDMATRAGMESIIEVVNDEELKVAVDELDAKIVLVSSNENTDTIVGWRKDIVKEGVTAIAQIWAKDNKQLEEVEEAWKLRDGGYQSVWVSDCLFKSGSDPTEHAGAIISAMKSKSSVKFASPRRDRKSVV